MKKILVIEDDQNIRENIAEILELSGYISLQAKNGKEGINYAKNSSPDLILCDVMMPELDGFGVLKILSKDPNLINIPFIFLTAKTEQSDFRKGMGLGADDYIIKPFDDTELLEAIEIRLQKSAVLKTSDLATEGPHTFLNQARAEEAFQNLIANREKRKYNKRDLIFESGGSPKYLLYLQSGQVKIFRTNEFGKEFTINIIQPGEYLGYLPILRNEAYEESAEALTDSIITFVPKEEFTQKITRSRDFTGKLISMLAFEASHSASRLLEIAYSSVRKKLANALLLLSADGTNKKLTISRDDLASLTGAAKETVTRTLSDFKNEEIIDTQGREIHILRMNELVDMPE